MDTVHEHCLSKKKIRIFFLIKSNKMGQNFEKIKFSKIKFL